MTRSNDVDHRQASAIDDASTLSGARHFDSSLHDCDREPIHIPGGIQPHGYLLVLNAALHIVQASANVGELAGRTVSDVLGQPIDRVIGAACAAAIAEVQRTTNIEARPLYIGRVTLARTGETIAPLNLREGADIMASQADSAYGARIVDVLLHAYAGALILEIEPTQPTQSVLSPIYALVRTFTEQVKAATTVVQLSALAVSEIRRLSGFGRVLIYRFDDEGNGHVLAEDKAPSYTSYLHHHFPAADIPRQARELYLRQRIRMIANARYQPAPLVPTLHPATGAATDLSYATLRSVSPVHLQYMRNMGTTSAMSISIVVHGKLWGLLSCHHHTARKVGFDVRSACEHLGEILSLQIEAKEDNAALAYRDELRRTLTGLSAAMSHRDDVAKGLAEVPQALLHFMSAHGAAVVQDGHIVRIGQTPDDAAITQIVEHIADLPKGDIFYTDALSNVIPDAVRYAKIASGVLALSISRLHRHFVLWFRPEVIQTIEWAGEPDKVHATQMVTPAPAASAEQADGGRPSSTATVPVPAALYGLSPRTSFKTWRETVRHRSHPWRASEMEVANDFRALALEVVLRQAEEMAATVKELGRVNKELESFSYSVSHDLRAPLRHIVGYGELLREYEGGHLADRGKRFLQNMVDSARFAGALVDDLLTFSQMGRAALRLAPVELRALVDVVIRELDAEQNGRLIQWQVGALPTVVGDAAFLILAIRNLLSNAVKYTKTRSPAIIDIAASETPGDYIVSVSDNGVGFNMRYAGKLFGVFQRLHRAEDFEGTGIGLANVRRIIDRHGGRTWAEGVPDKGATFFFAIPKQFTLDGAMQSTDDVS